MKRTLVKNISSNIIFTIINKAVNLVLIPSILIGIGESAYGIILLVSNVAGYFSLFQTGVPAATTRFVAQYQAKNDTKSLHQVVGSSIIFYLIIGVVIGLGLLIFPLAGGLKLFNIPAAELPTAKMLFWITALYNIVSLPLSVATQVMQGLQRYHEINIHTGILTTLGLAFAIFAARVLHSPLLVYLGQYLPYIFASLIQWVLIKKYYPSFHIRQISFSLTKLKEVFRFSFFVMIQQLGGMLVNEATVLFTALILPVASLTTLNIVTVPYNNIKMVILIGLGVLLPTITARFVSVDKEVFKSDVRKLVRYSNTAIACMCFNALLLTPPFIKLWVGTGYEPYIPIALLSVIAIALQQSTTIIGPLLNAVGKAKQLSAITIINSFACSAVLYFSIRWFGLWGAALATPIYGVLAMVFNFYMYLVKFTPLTSKEFFSEFFKGQYPFWLAGGIGYYFLSHFSGASNWQQFIFLFVVLLLISTIIVWFFILDSTEKKVIAGLLRLKK